MVRGGRTSGTMLWGIVKLWRLGGVYGNFTGEEILIWLYSYEIFKSDCNLRMV